MSNKENNESFEEIDELHIPHLGILHWFANENCINNSMHDKNKRNFGIRFFLEDNRAGTNWVYLTLKEELTLRTNHLEQNANIWFEKNEESHLKSILVEMEDIGCIEAFKNASEFINGILSVISFFYRRPIKISEIIVFDKKHDAHIFTKKYCPISSTFILPKASFKTKENIYSSLFALYREGMNSIDIPYRFICFFKIYEAWQKHHQKIFGKQKKPDLKITQPLLAGAYRSFFHSAFINKKFSHGDVFNKLNKLRDYLVHPIIDRGCPAGSIDLNDIDILEYIESLANLVERMVTKILDEELSILAENDVGIKMMLDLYEDKNEI